MTEPTRTRNLDIYGHAELPWSRARDLLARDSASVDLTFFLTTVRPDGRPHTAGVGALWDSEALYFTSGPGTLKSRLLATNAACSVGVRLQGIDLTLEGSATRVADPATVAHLAAVYHANGWPVTADGDTFTAPYSAPSAGPPPWYVYRFDLRTAFGIATAEPHGATRWDFSE
ncbi:pyridoxamine 5'-phosphate oxidase family protein [Amycolatopsis sp. NPDC051372]|uniref:pyridoxamine 5'-phosphate oxidase family protein n=1 Tax=Amycolatopsis sp. NPDC051372 TaxID=3155669 RepID=UPI0034293D22